MALHHPRVVLLALSTLLGIIGSLHAYTPLIPLDQLTVEEAYLERYPIQQQFQLIYNPNITAEQRDILGNKYKFNTALGPLKPNDLVI